MQSSDVNLKIKKQQQLSTLEKLKISEERYRMMVEDMPALICRFLPTGILTFVNSSYCEYFKTEKETLEGNNLFQFIPETERKKVRDHFASLSSENPVATYEHQVISPNGDTKWQQWTNKAIFDDDGNIIEYQSIGQDITDRKDAEIKKEQLEADLRQAHKLEVIGTMVGGIAHEFNNILCIITNNIELIEFDLPTDNPVHSYLKTIQRTTNRGIDVIKQLLNISRKRDIEIKKIDLEQLVNDTVYLLRASIPKNIEINCSINDDLNQIMADPSQIQQLLINLITNSAHAMEKNGGILHVLLEQLERTQFDKQINHQHQIKLTVIDTGCGIPKNDQERIFDPFFTTKEVNKGTGLGLSVVNGIVNTYGGNIKLQSTPGQGTTIEVYLPSIPSSKSIVSSEQDFIKKSLPIGTEKIVIIDDEKDLVTVINQSLKRQGYKVDAYHDPVDVIANIDKFDDVDLLITDLTMPKISGEQLINKVLEKLPNLPVVIITGYGEYLLNDHNISCNIKAIIKKPFTQAELTTVTRTVLNAKNSMANSCQTLKNCWDFKNCNYHPNNINLDISTDTNNCEMDKCPATTSGIFNGTNNGLYAGRFCWAVKETKCCKKGQEDYKKSIINCLDCDFFQLVSKEEDRYFTLSPSDVIEQRKGC